MFEIKQIPVKAYHNDNDSKVPCRPLIIASSGGGGHITAANAICKYLDKKGIVKEQDLPLHNPVLYAEKEDGLSRRLIKWGSDVANPSSKVGQKLVGSRIKNSSTIPALPAMEAIKKEIEKLDKSQLKADRTKKERNWRDLLLDDCLNGHESVAIWNLQQVNDETEELKKLIKQQSLSDKQNYSFVYNRYYHLLVKAYNDNTPYTEMISTQATALPALCDAVKAYNDYLSKAKANLAMAPQIKIHQYLTDMPTKGAVHFFNSLQNLSKEQRATMYLYGINFSEEVANHFGLFEPSFAGLYSIDPKDNPMIRQGFNDPRLKKVSCNKAIIIYVQTAAKDKEYKINADEKVLSIMLGSQASLDTVEYVKELADKFDKIFVFAGTNDSITKALQPFIAEKGYEGKIVLLGNQDDVHSAYIRTRSNLEIIRGGGITVAETLGMCQLANKLILVHCKEDPSSNQLTSGISWEDENVNEMISYFNHDKNIRVARTAVKRVRAQYEAIEKSVAKEKKEENIHQGEKGRYQQIVDMLKTSPLYGREEVENNFKILKSLETGDWRNLKKFKPGDYNKIAEVFVKAEIYELADQQEMHNLKAKLVDFYDGQEKLENVIDNTKKDLNLALRGLLESNFFPQLKTGEVSLTLTALLKGLKKAAKYTGAYHDIPALMQCLLHMINKEPSIKITAYDCNKVEKIKEAVELTYQNGGERKLLISFFDALLSLRKTGLTHQPTQGESDTISDKVVKGILLNTAAQDQCAKIRKALDKVPAEKKGGEQQVIVEEMAQKLMTLLGAILQAEKNGKVTPENINDYIKQTKDIMEAAKKGAQNLGDELKQLVNDISNIFVGKPSQSFTKLFKPVEKSQIFTLKI
jgi:hypothetical protein